MASIERNGTVSNPLRPDRRITGAFLDSSSASEKRSQKRGQATVAEIETAEKGDVKKKDATSTTRPDISPPLPEIVALRKQAASAVVEAIRRVIKSCGRVKMASMLQLLKREFVQCHKALAPHRSEDDFLAIIVMIEGALGNRDWKEIGKGELQACLSEVQIGERADKVTYDDYLQALRRLNSSGWKTGPTIDFDGEVFDPPFDPKDQEPPDE